MYCGFLVWVFFFPPLKICTSQAMGIGLCSPQLAAPSGWQLTGLVAAELCVLFSQCEEHTWCPLVVEKGTGYPRAVGSASSTWHSVSLCPCCQSPRAGTGSFPIPTPLSHCAAVVSCTLSSGRTQPCAGMKDATAPLGMGGQFIAFLCV